MSIGSNIKERRDAANLSQRELAEMVYITQSMLCQIERGSKTPTLPLSKQIADALGCTLEELVQ